MIDKRKSTAVKHDEDLSKLEEEVVAQLPQVGEETSQVQESEQALPSESASENENMPVAEETKPESLAEDREKVESSDEEISEPLSEKAQERFRKLANEKRELEQKLKALEGRQKRFENLIPDAPTHPTVVPQEEYKFPWERSEEVTAADVARKEAKAEIRKERILQRLDEDIKEVENKYPQLSVGSPEYDPDLDSWLVEETFKPRFNADNEYRLLDHVEKYMKLVDKVKEKARTAAASERTEKLAKQKAEQAVIGTNQAPPPEKRASDSLKDIRSIRELEQLESEINREARR